MLAPRVPQSPSAPAPGFTLVELLAATMVLVTGVLALAGGAVAIARLEREGARASRAAATAETRFEWLRAARCTPPSGTATTGPVTERWLVRAGADGVRELLDSVEVPSVAGRPVHVEEFRSAATC